MRSLAMPIDPAPSTVDIRPGELGEQAALVLLARIDEPGRPIRQYLAEPRLVLRQSA
jgi:LacI family transcriptional regulator